MLYLGLCVFVRTQIFHAKCQLLLTPSNQDLTILPQLYLISANCSPGLVVMGDDSCPRGHGFECRHSILDGLDIFHVYLLLNCIVCLKIPKINEREAGLAHFLAFYSTGLIYDLVLQYFHSHKYWHPRARGVNDSVTQNLLIISFHARQGSLSSK